MAKIGVNWVKIGNFLNDWNFLGLVREGEYT
jgi:hypothetical protein